MAHFEPSSRHVRLPIADGRSAEAQYLRRIRADLRQHVGGAPTIAQRLLIDRIAHTTLRLHGLDREPMLIDNGEFLELSRLLAELLAQLGGQPAAPKSSISGTHHCEVAA
jgi:hypothetical protein